MSNTTASSAADTRHDFKSSRDARPARGAAAPGAPVAVTSAQRLKGINVPTLKEQGIDVEIGNWRGVYGAPGLTDAQRTALTDMIVKAV